MTPAQADAYVRSPGRLREWLEIHFDASGCCTIGPDDARYYAKASYLLHAAGLRGRGARAARYALEQFIDAAEWRAWYRENRQQLYFTDTGGYRFKVRPY